MLRYDFVWLANNDVSLTREVRQSGVVLWVLTDSFRGDGRGFRIPRSRSIFFQNDHRRVITLACFPCRLLVYADVS
jgi:hypothetical protein